jgi:hypothetical protein
MGIKKFIYTSSHLRHDCHSINKLISAIVVQDYRQVLFLHQNKDDWGSAFDTEERAPKLRPFPYTYKYGIPLPSTYNNIRSLGLPGHPDYTSMRAPRALAFLHAISLIASAGASHFNPRTYEASSSKIATCNAINRTVSASSTGTGFDVVDEEHIQIQLRKMIFGFI